MDSSPTYLQGSDCQKRAIKGCARGKTVCRQEARKGLQFTRRADHKPFTPPAVEPEAVGCDDAAHYHRGAHSNVSGAEAVLQSEV